MATRYVVRWLEEDKAGLVFKKKQGFAWYGNAINFFVEKCREQCEEAGLVRCAQIEYMGRNGERHINKYG